MQPPTSSLRYERTARRRYKPDALMYVTVAFLWTSVWRFQDLWPIIGKLQIPVTIEAVLGLTILASLNGPRNLKWAKSRIFAIPLILLAIMIAGVPISLWPGQSVTFITKDFGPSLLLMVAVVLSVREVEDLEWIAFAHLVGATVYSLWIYLYVPVGSDARLGELVHYDANDFALMVVCTIPFAIYFLRPGQPFWKRLFALFSLALFVEMVIKSGSRGGFLAFIALMAYVAVAFRSIPARLRISAVAGCILVLTIFGSAKYWDMMRTTLHPQSDYNMTEQTGRKFVWKRGIGYMFAKPILGVGASSFTQAEGRLSAISRRYAESGRGLKWSTAHNSFVLVGAELGVAALVLFVTMIGTAFVRLARINRESQGNSVFTPDDAACAQMLIASLIGFCIAGFFVSAAYFSFLYALIGLIVAEESLRSRRLSLGVVQSVGRAAVASTATHGVAKPAARSHWAPAG